MAVYDVRTAAAGEVERRLEEHRAELVAYCGRMLASPFEAEDAVQRTLMRAWRGLDRFEGRASLRSWLYRIATNVCFDMLVGSARRRSDALSIDSLPESAAAPADDPADVAVARETIRLAFVAALRHLTARQRAALLLCEVLRWRAAEVAELLDTTAASVNSALQRARARLTASGVSSSEGSAELQDEQRAFLERYVRAFEEYDLDALASVIREDARRAPALGRR